MSEKNEQTGLWPKSVSVSALAGTQKQQLQRQVSDYSISGAALDMVPLSLTSPSVAARNIVYDNTSHHSTLRPEDVSYTTARFQTPLINHALTSTSAALVATSQTIASNVPAPSGFLPSSFASASTVLTANQYAAQSSTNNNQSTTPQITGQRILFGVEQFHNLNSQQQQYEFNKLMASSFSSAQSSTHLPVTSGNNPTTSSAFRQNHSAQEQTTSGAIPSQIAEQVISAISSGGGSGGGGSSKLSVAPPHGRLLGLGVRTLDDEKLKSVQQVVESGVSEHAKQQVMQILDRISTLRPVEKLLLYLRLPGEMPETDPLRQPQNPLGTRSEINHTINWVRTHLEQDPQVSIPKQDVYNDYLLYCDRLDIKPLSTADFGKVMKQVFPGIRPRRLGTRGHSRYCYAAMRKTSKLPAPHLPTICSTTSNAHLELEKNCPDNNTSEDREQYWPVIKQWAESILHTKVENFIDLANHVKHQLSGTHAPYPGSTRATATQKKHQNKEKRLLADMGPLKKRRKKKRKGSSSSESSYNQHQTQEQQLSPSNSPKLSQQSVCSPAEEDGQKSLKMIKIKQEVVDTSIYPAVLTHPNLPQIVEPSLQQQSELMPMNLAAESREGLIDCSALGSRVPPPPPLHTSESQTTTNVGAVKNLTPKIIEISSLEKKSPANILPAHITIKEEVIIDDYSTSNIFCKKVLKAQQTKGFWVNSPKPAATPASSTTTALPIITTTASTPPPISGGVTTSPPHTASSNFSMGPPTSQMAPSVSPHCYNLQDDSGNNCPPQAKVLSRNLQQLRAKKILAAAAATACDPSDVSVVKDTDLPENLGLPRERVISICNMDKHELDDYFLPVEEENSEDQETELLQYFQMGDAEGKLNRNPSSDAASNKNNNSTVVAQVTSSATVTTAPLAMATMSNNKMTPQIPANKLNVSAQVMSTAALSDSVNKIAAVRSGISNNVNLLSTTYDAVNAASSVLTPPATVGSASASLTPLSQKHHQQKRQLNHHEQQQQQQVQEKLAIKRKVNVNALTATPDINATRKNYSFLPISPNINTTPLSGGSGPGNNGSFFASPSMSRLLTKQHSLDCDSSDPMIGSGRRKRSYFNVTSASAPPSPSLLNKKQEQLHCTSKSILIGPWLAQGGMSNGNFRYNDNAAGVASVSTSMLTDQNSLDLDLFGETSEPVPTSCCNKNNTEASLHTADIGITGADVFNVLNEVTQRSQSVPLSQLQRSHSPNFNRSFEASTANAMYVYSACPSQTQTPIPTDFGDSTTMLSENSCSQQSATIKLEEVGGVVASDTTVILDEVDVNEILSSPDFVTKFSSLNQSSTPIATCSSTGSSSGYSSAGNFTASINGNISARSALVSGMSATVSRSVPSTPLPHLHNQHNIFSSVRRIYDRNTQAFNTVSSNNRLRYTESNNNYTCRVNSGSYLFSRSNCDISKSMPSTPITITSSSFRYSPSEITNDLFINGHTLDESISSTFSGVDNENLMGADVVGINAPLTREPMLTNNEDFVNDSKKSPNDLNILNFATQPVPDTSTLSDTAMLMTSELLDNL